MVIIVIDPTSHEQSQTFNNYHRDVKIGTRNRRRIQTHKDARDDTLNSNRHCNVKILVAIIWQCTKLYMTNVLNNKWQHPGLKTVA